MKRRCTAYPSFGLGCKGTVSITVLKKKFLYDEGLGDAQIYVDWTQLSYLLPEASD